MAVVGKGFAVLESGKVRLSGLFAWLVWGGVHLQFLAQRNLRVAVFLQWVWTGVTGQRGSRLILNSRASAGENSPHSEPHSDGIAKGSFSGNEPALSGGAR
jgi:hypothetical protein